ncbi:MAG: hypothetical protein HZA36_02130 [Parcubacteria group bacterium]|nr:hypothetical protein [Parcubacteria group bacterium]
MNPLTIPEANAVGVGSTEGMVAYGMSGNGTPKYKLWDGTSFGTQAAANAAQSQIRWLVLQGAPRLRNEKIMGVVGGGSSAFYVQRWNGSTWSDEWNTTLTTIANRTFSIAYENFNANAIVVYGDNTTQLKYRKWDGTSWTGELNAGTALTGIPQMVQSSKRPPYVNTRKNDIAILIATDDGKLHAMRWNNGAFGDQVTMSNNPSSVTNDVADVAYERTSGEVMVVWGTASSTIVYRKFINSWQSETTAYSGLSSNATWLALGHNRVFGANHISVIWNQAGNQKIEMGVWNGSSWETRPAAIDTDNVDRRNVSTAWEKHTGKAVFVFSQKTPNAKALSWRTWTAANGFSAVTQESNELSQKIRWMRLHPDGKGNEMMVTVLDIGGDLHTRRWDGNGSWSTTFTDIVTGISSATTEPFFFFWDDTAAGMVENYYRWYVDNNTISTTDPWPVGNTNLGENAVITKYDLPPANGETLRLRVSLNITTIKLVAGETRMRLQFAQKNTSCAAVTQENWIDVGSPTSTSLWRGSNGTPTNGTVLSTDPPTAGDLKLSVSDRAWTYEEGDISALNPYGVVIGEDVEMDWFIQNNGATPKTTYCFRVATEEKHNIDNYTFFPELITSGYRPKTQNWRWYDDENNETPSTSLANENVAPSSVGTTSTIKLRITVAETANVAGSNIKFKVQTSQYSDFSRGVSDLTPITLCIITSGWCYGNGVDVDNDAITTRLLTDSTSNGTHNEIASSSSTLSPTANSSVEIEFTIKHTESYIGKTYFFRVFDVTDDIPAPTNTGATYPSLVMEGGTLTFTVGGLPSGTNTAGIVTDVTTTATTIPFGNIATSSPIEAAQRLTLSTNAMVGYIVRMYQTQQLSDDRSRTIPAVSGTNASPSVWSIPSGQSGAYGYHTTDATLGSGTATRFADNNTYAQLDSTAREIAYSSIPISNDSTDVIFKIELTSTQATGIYNNTLVYIIIPIF